MLKAYIQLFIVIILTILFQYQVDNFSSDLADTKAALLVVQTDKNSGNFDLQDEANMY